MTFQDKKYKKILIVENDKACRDLCERLLTDAGHYVEVALNGMDALDKLRDSMFDLVITAIIMPGLDGISLYVYSLRQHPHLRENFLFISDNTSQEMQDHSIITKMHKKILNKPIKKLILLEHIERITRIDKP